MVVRELTYLSDEEIFIDIANFEIVLIVSGFKLAQTIRKPTGIKLESIIVSIVLGLGGER